jgi:lipopolysaccharide transport protein LptA
LRAAAAILVLLAGAQTGDRLRGEGKPVEMTAKGRLQIDLEKHVGVATGDVVIRREDVTVCCDRAEARFSGDRVEWVECRGRVVIVRPDGTRARADAAVFDATKDQVTLSGRARVRSAEADLEGQEIVYDIAADKLDVAGGPSRFRFAHKDLPPFELDRACPPAP